jgi:hypothetical protein
MAIKYFGDKRHEARVEYVGCVLSTRTKVERVMSDIYADCYYATVWDDAACKVVERMTNSAFECYMDPATAEVDATDEVKEKVKAYYEGRAYAAKIAHAEAAIEKAALVAKRKAAAEKKKVEVAKKRAAVEKKAPKVGDEVIVTRGNNDTPKGTEGMVCWAGWSKNHDASWRIGFDTEDGDRHWIAATGVKVTKRDGGDGKKVAREAKGAAKAAAPKVKKGDRVTVGDVKGRVVWAGTDKFTGAPRVGVKPVNGGDIIWTDAGNATALKE